MARTEAQKKRAEIRANIRNLKELAKANSRNHSWEDREIARMEKELEGLKSHSRK